MLEAPERRDNLRGERRYKVVVVLGGGGVDQGALEYAAVRRGSTQEN